MSFTNTVNPDFDKSNQGTLQGVINQAIRQAMVNLECMLPATVISYDRTNNVASVQPSIMVVGTDGSLVGRAPLASVPVLAIGGGGFVLNFPQTAGGKGWIKASDRDISLYLQSGGQVGPNTARLHSFSDGMFIPDIGSGFTLNGEDAVNAVLQSIDGTIRIAVWSNQVKITTPDGTLTLGPGKTLLTTIRFDVNSPDINFSSAPHVGPLPP